MTSSGNSPHKGQWHGALMFSLISTWINSWVNDREAGDSRCHHAYDVIVIKANGTVTYISAPMILSIMSQSGRKQQHSRCSQRSSTAVVILLPRDNLARRKTTAMSHLYKPGCLFARNVGWACWIETNGNIQGTLRMQNHTHAHADNHITWHGWEAQSQQCKILSQIHQKNTNISIQNAYLERHTKPKQ